MPPDQAAITVGRIIAGGLVAREIHGAFTMAQTVAQAREIREAFTMARIGVDRAARATTAMARSGVPKDQATVARRVGTASVAVPAMTAMARGAEATMGLIIAVALVASTMGQVGATQAIPGITAPGITVDQDGRTEMFCFQSAILLA